MGAILIGLLKSPLILPLLTGIVTEGLKSFLETAVAKIPNRLVMPLAAGIGAVLGNITVNDPALGALLGAAAAPFHDLLTPPKPVAP